MPDYTDITPERIGELRAEEARRVTQGYEIDELRAMRIGELSLLKLELAAEHERAMRAERERDEARRDLETVHRDHRAVVGQLAKMEEERAAALHKAEQYDDVVQAVQAADGGRYRNDTIEALLHRLSRLEASLAVLREAFEQRHICKNCGGRGVYWTDVNGEAEAEACDCWIRADHVLYHEDHDAGQALLTRLASLTTALEPFARFAEAIRGDCASRDDAATEVWDRRAVITWGDLRRAMKEWNDETDNVAEKAR